MPRLQRTHIEAYVFRRRGGRVEFLCLRRARDRSLGGVWQPVTGKSRPRETALAGAVREVHEETGLSPRRWWALETVTAYYDPAKDVVLMLPLFAAEAGAREAVRLSEEHDAHRWLPARAAGRLYLWEAQRIGLEAVRREVLGRRDLARALEVTALAARAGGHPVAKRRPGRSK